MMMNEEQKNETLAHVRKLKETVSDDKKLKEAFEGYVKTWKPVMNAWLQPYKGKYLPSLYKKGLLPSIISENKKLLYTNLIQCESHRDILLNAINPTKK